MKFHKWFENDISIVNEWLADHRVLESKNNKVTFVGGGLGFLDDIISVVASGIRDKENIDPEVLRYAIRRVLFNPKLELPLKAQSLISIINSQLSKGRGSEKKYVLLSGFYLEGDLPFKRISMPGALISLFPARNLKSKTLAKFMREQDGALETINEEVQINSAAKQVIVKVFVTARSEREAANLAINSFDQLRGLINYSFNTFKLSNISFGKIHDIENRVFNRVVSFRFHSLHELNGKFIDGNLYYVRSWTKPKNVARLIGANAAKVNKALLIAKGHLQRKHGMHTEAWTALLYYCRALDVVGYQSSFTRLWAVMEYLSGISPTDRHDKIVSRNAFLYSNNHPAKLILNHLRLTRNELIHTGAELDPDYEETIIYQLNRYVCYILWFYIVNKMKFQKQEDFIAFLDHSTDKEKSLKKLEIAKKAFEFLRD